MMNKKSQMLQTFIYIIMFIFALGVLYVSFNYVFSSHLAPTILQISDNNLQDSAQKEMVSNGVNNYLRYFGLFPFVLLFSVIVFGLISAIYKQSTGGEFQ